MPWDKLVAFDNQIMLPPAPLLCLNTVDAVLHNIFCTKTQTMVTQMTPKVKIFHSDHENSVFNKNVRISYYFVMQEPYI